MPSITPFARRGKTHLQTWFLDMIIWMIRKTSSGLGDLIITSIKITQDHTGSGITLVTGNKVRFCGCQIPILLEFYH